MKITVEGTKEDLASLFVPKVETGEGGADPLLQSIKNGFLTRFKSTSTANLFIYLYSTKDKDGAVTASVANLAKYSNITENTVRIAVQEMKSCGLLTVSGEEIPNKPLTYTINLSQLQQSQQGVVEKIGFRASLSEKIRNAVERAGYGRTNKKTEDILGISLDEFVAYVENKFSEGMNWENRHRWVIDHIVPISKAKTLREAEKLNHHTNLTPLWALDNAKKSNKTL